MRTSLKAIAAATVQTPTTTYTATGAGMAGDNYSGQWGDDCEVVDGAKMLCRTPLISAAMKPRVSHILYFLLSYHSGVGYQLTSS